MIFACTVERRGPNQASVHEPIMQLSKFESERATEHEHDQSLLLTATQLLFLALVQVIAYWSTLNNYFLNSDFAHVHFAQIALNDPSLFLREFTTSWLGAGDFELCYRPLPLFLIAFNLLAGGAQPFGFHLTSVALHVLCSWTVYFLVLELLQWFSMKPHLPVAGLFRDTRYATAFLSAALFGLFPINAEAVIWLGGRPDCASGLFLALTLYFWLKEQQCGKLKFGLLAMVAYMVSLLFKESAIVLVLLPPLLWLLKPGSAVPAKPVSPGEHNVNKDVTAVAMEPEQSMTLQSEPAVPLKQRLFNIARSCWKLLSVLLVYLLLRWMALGTLGGGYKGAFWQLLNDDYLLRWAQPDHIRMLFLPFNPSFSFPLPLEETITCLYVLIAVLLFSSSRAFKPLVSLFIFCVAWFFICLIPDLQIAALSPSLTNGRAYYGSSIPFCFALALVLTQPLSVNVKWRKVVSIIGAVSFLTIFMTATIVNNEAWRKASQATRALQLQLAELIADAPSEINVMVLNPPISIHGVYGLNQALLPMTQTQPFMRNSNYHRVLLHDREHFVARDANLINATALRQHLLRSPVVTKWQPVSETLTKFDVIPDMMPLYAHNVSINEIEEAPDSKTFEIFIDPSLISTTCEALEVSFSCEGTMNYGYATLSWRKNYREQADDVYDSDLPVSIDGDAKMRTYRFSLAEQVGWYVQPPLDTLYLTIHNVKAIKNLSARLATDANYVPHLRPDTRTLTATPVGLTPVGDQAVFICDSEIDGAAGLVIELSKPNECFETYNRTYRDTKISENALKRWTADGTSASFPVPIKELKPGFYTVRAAAIDAKRCVVGAFSDPVVFYVGAGAK